MNFFENQIKAKRNTGLLISLYALSVFIMICGIYLGILAIFEIGKEKAIGNEYYSNTGSIILWKPDLFFVVAGVILIVVFFGSLYKTLQLAGGGEAIAEMLGGRLLLPNTKDPAERKILNVVEEMSIASGMRVPPVYLLDGEEGINAFAAGFSPSKAVVAVSRGCLTHLSRDELQGVVAHEFSHIFNGDMKLNIRLMGVLHGILIIALTGYLMLRMTGGRRYSSSSKNDSRGVILALGLLLMVLGYIGVFFAKLIKMAVSRQREFLADASAVQFTRNPDGIAGALKKIGGFVYGSQIEHPQAEEASHMFFANGLKEGFSSLFATHPPLPIRIKRIDRHFDGNFPVMDLTPKEVEEIPAKKEKVNPVDSMISGKQILTASIPILAGSVVNKVGTITDENLSHAKDLISQIPETLTSRAREPYGAMAVIYCLLLDKDPDIRKQQLSSLSENIDQGILREIGLIQAEALELSAEFRLPLIDLALPALGTLWEDQYQSFRSNIQLLVEADQQISLFEYTLQTILIRHLDSKSTKQTKNVKNVPLNKLLPLVNDLLLALAYLGNPDNGQAGAAYQAGAETCGITPELRHKTPPEKSITVAMIDGALEVISVVDPMIKAKILEACVSCVTADNSITINEAELIRAIADSMECPLPPFTGYGTGTDG